MSVDKDFDESLDNFLLEEEEPQTLRIILDILD